MIRAIPLALVLVAAPLEARDWSSAGGWDIAESGTETCAMAQEYEGEGDTVLALGLRVDGTVYMSVTNSGWSTKPDQAYDLVYFLNGTAYEGGTSLGIANGLRKGFLTKLEPDFLTHFAASTYLTIESKDGVTVDDLKLDGSAAGLAQVRRCVAHRKVVLAAEAREKARFAHIPPDPFASVAGAPLTTPEPAKPRANIQSFISAEDYPASAQRAGEQGSVGVRLSVDASGRVSDCTVTASSGSTSLDSATCRIIRSRARYTPSRDASGNPQSSTTTDRVVWVLPE